MAYCYQFYDRHIYSVRVIYLIILNLPWSIHYSKRMCFWLASFLVPLSPHYLSPLVHDLILGLHMKICGTETKKLVRAALPLVSCDLSAGRRYVVPRLFSKARLKATVTCNFDRDTWIFCTNSLTKHHLDMETLLRCTFRSECEHKAIELGCRFSMLLNLPYFNPVRMLVVDLMHNLFLGTTKIFIRKILFEQGILSKQDLKWMPM